MEDEVKSKVMNGIRIGLGKVKTLMLQEIKEATPVDTGFMRENIHIRNEKSNGSFSIYNPADYASFVEKGTGNIIVGSVEQPRKSWKAKTKRGDSGPSTMPFMRPSFYKNRKIIGRIIAESIREAFL